MFGFCFWNLRLVYFDVFCARTIQWRSQEFDWGVYALTSHCNFKTCVNVPHVNKTVTDFGGIYTDIPPVATPWYDCTVILRLLYLLVGFMFRFFIC